MKTIIYSLAVAAACFFVCANASAQYHRDYEDQYHRRTDDQCRNDNQQAFYYYPQSNVYYSFSTGKYIYFDRNAWVVSERIPHRYRLRNEPRFVVNHYGFDVWNENRFHAMKYRDYRRFQPDVAYDHYDVPDRRNDRDDNNWKR